MTLHATREGQRITIHGNTGVDVQITNSAIQHARITEDAQHVRYFWHQLGEHLNAADAERKEGSAS